MRPIGCLIPMGPRIPPMGCLIPIGPLMPPIGIIGLGEIMSPPREMVGFTSSLESVMFKPRDWLENGIAGVGARTILTPPGGIPILGAMRLAPGLSMSLGPTCILCGMPGICGIPDNGTLNGARTMGWRITNPGGCPP